LAQPKDDSGLGDTVGLGTEAGMVMGTVGYMSPEQVRGETADHRSDIFAFGTILYEMVTGKQTFRKPTSGDTMTAILNVGVADQFMGDEFRYSPLKELLCPVPKLVMTS
jgi:serine/threonine protein kinase